MIAIPKSQILQRWDTVPQRIRELLTDETTANTITEICSREHISEDKEKIVSKIVGAVLLGFIHQDDVTREIQMSTNIPGPVAQIIATELDKKIFAPIKNDLVSIYTTPRNNFADIAPPKPLEIISKEPPAGGQKPIPPIPSGPVILQKTASSVPIPERSSFKLETKVPQVPSQKASTPLPPKPARVEFGNIVIQNAAPKLNVAPTKKSMTPPMPPMRTVHYTDLRTPLTIPTPPKNNLPSMLVTSSSSKPIPVPPKDLPIKNF